MEKTVEQVFDEMTDEQKAAIMIVIEHMKTRSAKHSDLMHYGVKGMKWGKRMSDSLMEDVGSINTDAPWLEDDELTGEEVDAYDKIISDKYELYDKVSKLKNEKNGAFAAVKGLGIKAAATILKARKKILDIKVTFPPILSNKRTTTTVSMYNGNSRVTKKTERY